ncbi:MAG TPA: hypothetical protein VF603_10500 [Allosphingosinicella sp.]|jgi:uncharacterized protein YneF (UPF0154 family)
MATGDLGEPRLPAGDGAGGEVRDWERRQFSPTVINAGFITGLVLAILCLLIAGWYLIAYRQFASEALENPPQREQLVVHIYLARALLQSCGLATGMAFGFLGFSLFLIGVGGNMDASGSSGNVGVQVARISPGAFVMLCSAILVGICATSAIPAEAGGERRAANSEDATNSAGNEQAYNGLDANVSDEEQEEVNRIMQSRGNQSGPEQ